MCVFSECGLASGLSRDSSTNPKNLVLFSPSVNSPFFLLVSYLLPTPTTWGFVAPFLLLRRFFTICHSDLKEKRKEKKKNTLALHYILLHNASILAFTTQPITHKTHISFLTSLLVSYHQLRLQHVFQNQVSRNRIWFFLLLQLLSLLQWMLQILNFDSRYGNIVLDYAINRFDLLFTRGFLLFYLVFFFPKCISFSFLFCCVSLLSHCNSFHVYQVWILNSYLTWVLLHLFVLNPDPWFIISFLVI